MAQKDLPLPCPRGRVLEEVPDHGLETRDPGLRGEGPNRLGVNGHPQVLHPLLWLQLGFRQIHHYAELLT